MFEARLLEPGVVSYKDVGGPISMLPRETIARCVNSFVGKPLIYVPRDRKDGKPGGKHMKITPENAQKHARGYVTSVFEGPDGWWWCRGVCFDDEAKDMINAMGLCSCGYHVEAASEGGTHHAIQYDETIEEFSGEHLAIVDRPRYEGATIRLNCKKTEPQMNLIKWVKKIAAAGAEPAKPAADAGTAANDKNNAVGAPEDISATTEFEIPSLEAGKTVKVTLGTLIEAYNARENGIDPEAEIEIGGNPVKLGALVDAYNARENATPPPTPTPAPVAKPSHFRVLVTARENSAAVPTGGAVDTMEDRLSRGANRYGSKPAAK